MTGNDVLETTHIWYKRKRQSPTSIRMTFVTLRIYKFYILDFVPEFHAEISAYGKSISYSDEGIEISMTVDKNGLDGYKLVKRIALGFSGVSENVFMERYLPDLVENFTIDKYKLFSNNCRHFALHLIHVLRPSRPEIGLSVLSGLNNMSELLGKARDLIFINLIRSFVSNPMAKIQFLTTVSENCLQGKLLSSSVQPKDMILILNCILLVCFWVIRARL